MRWRRAELAHLSGAVDWLEAEQAQAVYRRAQRVIDPRRHALEPARVDEVERWAVEGRETEAGRWLRGRILGPGRLWIAYARTSVCHVSPWLFLQAWTQMLAPGRDDAVVLPDGESWVLYYCHEDVFEFGRLVPGALPEAG